MASPWLQACVQEGQLGSSVGWVGYDVVTNADAQTVQVSIKKEFMDELLANTAELLTVNVVGRRDLKSYTGKVCHVANMIWVLKTIMEQLRAACEHSGAAIEAVFGGVRSTMRSPGPKRFSTHMDLFAVDGGCKLCSKTLLRS